MATFKDELKNICNKRGITFAYLAEKLGFASTRLAILGTTKGISFNDLNRILKIIKADFVESEKLRHLAKFTVPRNRLIINDEFIKAVDYELIANDKDWEDAKAVCKAVLKFAGVKTKVI